MIIGAWLAALGELFSGLLPAPPAVLEAVNFVISFSDITFLFAMIFKLLMARLLPRHLRADERRQCSYGYRVSCFRRRRKDDEG